VAHACAGMLAGRASPGHSTSTVTAPTTATRQAPKAATILPGVNSISGSPSDGRVSCGSRR
jgi:hypothetical protein